LHKLALAVILVLIVIGVTVAGFLEIEGIGKPARTYTCGQPPQGCGTTTSTRLKGNTTPSTIIETSTSNSTSLISGCAPATVTPINGYGANITLPAGQTLNFCVQLYYYSSTADAGPATVNLTRFASLESLFGSQLHTALTNFTITYATAQGTETPSSVHIGGPSNENEGFLVEYQITPKPGITNGAYGLNLEADEPNPSGGVEGCTTDFLIVLGNGVPNYDNVGSCVDITASQSAGTPYIPDQLIAAGFGVSYTNG
jgi:hypothetical protein